MTEAKVRDHCLYYSTNPVHKPSRNLSVGTWVKTRFNGGVSTHIITKKLTGQASQSGILFNVDPPLSDGTPIDADWFWPSQPPKGQK